MSNVWTNMWNKMMEEKEGAGRRNSKEGFEENENACIVKYLQLFTPYGHPLEGFFRA